MVYFYGFGYSHWHNTVKYELRSNPAMPIASREHEMDSDVNDFCRRTVIERRQLYWQTLHMLIHKAKKSKITQVKLFKKRIYEHVTF